MIKKSKFLKIFVIFCFIGYLCLSAFLVYHASLDGKESSNQSSAVGDELSGIVNDTKGDQTILIEPTDLIIENEIYSAHIGQSYKLKCKTLPEDSSYKSLKYESSDSKIASISTSGTINFLKEGEVKITVSNKDYPEIKKTFNVEVNKINLNSFSSSLVKDNENVKLDNGIYLLKQYETYTINNSFEPEDASITKVSYTYDKNYVSISNNKLYAKEPINELKINTICDGIENSFTIRIEEVVIEVIDIIDYNFSKTKIDMHVNEKISLLNDPFGVSFSPKNTTNKNLTYVSKNPEIVNIENNKLVGKSAGIATIEAVSQDKGIKKEVQIEVTNIIGLKEEEFTLVQEYLKYNEKDNSYHIRNGMGGNINCNFIEEATFTNATYSSSNEKVLLVGEDGQLTPIKIGKAKVTIIIDDGYSTPLTYEIDIVVEGKPFLENLSEFYYFVRKSIGHFGAFFVLGGLGGFAFLFTFDKKKWLFSVPLTVGLGFGVASLTEYIQTFVPGRYGSWSDVWLDFSGYMTATLVVSIIVGIVYLINYLKNKKHVE